MKEQEILTNEEFRQLFEKYKHDTDFVLCIQSAFREGLKMRYKKRISLASEDNQVYEKISVAILMIKQKFQISDIMEVTEFEVKQVYSLKNVYMSELEKQFRQKFMNYPNTNLEIKSRKIAMEMFEKGFSLLDVKNVTGLSADDVKELAMEAPLTPLLPEGCVYP